VTYARRRLRGALHPIGDARLSALHRGIYGVRSRAGRSKKASPSASSSRPLVVAEGGFPEPPGVCLHRQTRGTPHPVLPWQCLAKSTLGGRDGRIIVVWK